MADDGNSGHQGGNGRQNPDQPYDAQRKRPEIPWDRIRREFICNPETSMARMARKYHVIRMAISRRAAGHGWHALRIEFIATVERKARDTIAVELSRVAARSLAASDAHTTAGAAYAAPTVPCAGVPPGRER